MAVGSDEWGIRANNYRIYKFRSECLVESLLAIAMTLAMSWKVGLITTEFLKSGVNCLIVRLFSCSPFSSDQILAFLLYGSKCLELKHSDIFALGIF